MDGNGRWAENKGLPRSEGHRAGVEVVKRIIRASMEHTIPVISLWAFGRDNWARPQSEVDYLMQLLSSALEMELDALHKNEVRLLFTGDRTELSDALQQAIGSAERYTQHNTRLTLNVVFNYSGKWDIVQGAKKLIHDVVAGTVAFEDVDESLFALQCFAERERRFGKTSQQLNESAHA